MNKQREALERLKQYIARRKAARGIDHEYIHGFSPGSPSEATLLLSDIEALLALAEPEQEPEKRLQWHLDSEASKFLADMILSGDQPTEITLSVGLIQEDSGAIKHGLLVHETELPEEGTSLLVECEPIGLSPQPRELQPIETAKDIDMEALKRGQENAAKLWTPEAVEEVLGGREPMPSDKIDDVFASALASMRKHSKTATGALTDEDRYEFHVVRAIERFHGIGE